jgi:CubicO group peptidase (beta-lactamase class C family)
MTTLAPETVRHLHRVLAGKQSDHRIPGIVAGVARDGQLLWSEGVGAADLANPDQPPTTDTQFLIASNTKTFTAVLVMALRDEGKLSLDDTVETHIPESTHHGITIRQLLAHVTGMQREPVGDIWDTLVYPDRKELVAGWNEAERILRPHHKWHYSNLGFAMLGEIVARIEGREWAESLQARILDPLGMRRTTVGPTGKAAVGYYVPPFTDVATTEPLLEIKATAPAGALASTVEDLARWGAFLAEADPEILSPDTLEEMCQPQIVADLTGWRMAWGLGLMLMRDGDRMWVGHDGGMPGHITSLLVHRASKTVTTVLTNSTSTPDPSGMAMQLGGYVVEHEPPEPEVWRPGSAVPEELVPLLGTWFSEGRPFTFSVRQGRLEARLDAAPATMKPSVFVAVGVDLYRTESGRETGELLRINRDAAGAVTHLNWATYRFTREPLAFGEWL